MSAASQGSGAPRGGTHRPFLRPRSLALVALGGTVGTAAREGLILAVPGATPLPWAIVAANLAGAFVLGLLLEALTRRASPSHRTTSLRLLLGTGFCGGFTTYSTLATGTLALIGLGSAGHGAAPGWGWAAGYALGTVVLGAAATWCGILVGSRRHSPSTPPSAESTGGTQRATGDQSPETTKHDRSDDASSQAVTEGKP